MGLNIRDEASVSAFPRQLFLDGEAICVEMPAVHEGDQRGDVHLVISLRDEQKIENSNRFDAGTSPNAVPGLAAVPSRSRARVIASGAASAARC